MTREAAAVPGWIVRQKRAAEKLRREVMGLDGSLEHPYFRTFDRQLREYRKVATLDALVAAAAKTDLIYLGDFHALPACQAFAADFISRLTGRGVPLVLGIEFIYTRQQRVLDRRQRGDLDDAEFLRRLHYQDEWGYPWDGFRGLLDRARELEIPVHALDSPPRGGFDGLSRRDNHAARRIASIFSREPGRCVLVFFGESHLASTHLPQRVRATLHRSGKPKRELRLFQNPDRLYWQAVGEDRALPLVAQVDDATWAVCHTSPLSKYEAYRQVLDRWRGDPAADDAIDLTPAVHDLIGFLFRGLGVQPGRHRIKHRAGWSEDLADAYPEVYSGGEAVELLPPILAEQGRTAEEIDEARLRLRDRGALYDSRSNTLFLSQFLPGPAAGEAARFVRAALTRRLFIAAEDFADDPVSRAYGAAFTEALAFLGARMVDPTTDYPGSVSGVPAVDGGSHQLASPVQDWQVEVWLGLHRRFEDSPMRRLPAELIEPLEQSRPLRRRLARELGLRLGRELYGRIRRDELDARGLRRLFSRPLEPRKAQGFVIQLLRGSGS